MMNIGEFARLGGITTRMLRHYDALGLLVPAHVDPHSARRSYDLAQLSTLNRLLALKGLGFRLDEIGPLLAEGVDPAELHGMLRLREAELERQVRHQRHTLDRVRARLRLIEQETQMPVETKHLEPITLAALSADSPDASRQQTGAVVQTLFDQVIDRMEAAGADRTTPIARYHPHPTTTPHPTKTTATGSQSNADGAGDPAVRVVAGYALSGEPVPGLDSYTLPATEVAAVLHRGPMNTISVAYQELARWAESTGRAPTTFSWREYYLEAPGDDQSDWIVEVQLEL
ncbi:MerR family transcriptional regulator [Kribbella sp. NPDC051620]|uniref:MerR family transcriptional regulator n=1 Tax=Kribbella sp. NPDC051620 TaxID=3364120 RepID=UPI0037960153